jgi:hypothetical protein
MSRTLQFRRLGTATLANTIGANGELIINTTNKTLTVHDGITPGGSQLLNDFVEVDIDQYARNTANTAISNISVLQGVDNTQNNTIVFVNQFAQNAYDKANSAYDYANNSVDGWARDEANSKFNSSGGQISGNVVIVGNLDVTGNTVVANHMEANTVIVETTLYSGLATRQATPLPNLIAQFTSNSASYIQVNTQNIDPLGSADYVITADNGTDSDFFVDLGLKGSQSNDQLLRAYDGYLTVQGSTIGQPGGNLIIGTTSSFTGLETKFVAGGYDYDNLVMKLGTYGANIIGDLTVTGNIIGSTINAINEFAQAAFNQANTGGGTSYDNANVATFLADYGNNNINTTGNITTGNLSATLISSTTIHGNVDVVLGNTANVSATKTRIVTDTTFSYIQTGNGTIGSTGNIVFSPYLSPTQRVVIDTASGNLTASGNVTAQNFIGNISITGNVTGTSANVDLVAGSYEWSFDNTGNLTLPGNTFDVKYANGTLVDIITRFEGSWNVATGNTTQSFTVDPNNTYQMWVEGNIPNGIIAWNATATVTNTNVPVAGAQYAWVYSGGGTPIDFTSIPNQFEGIANTIVRSSDAPSANTNRFEFGINNTSGSAQTVRYGWIKIS